MFRLWISSIEFGSGEEVTFERDSLIILTGGNSTGKSRALKEIYKFLGSGGYSRPPKGSGTPTYPINKVTIQVEGDEVSFKNWLDLYYPPRIRNDKDSYFTLTKSFTGNEIPAIWRGLNSGNKLNTPYIPFFARLLTTEDRLQIVNPKEPINNLYSGIPREYIHLLQLNSETERRISSEVRRAYGVDLIIDWGKSNQVSFFVGDAPIRTAEIDRVHPNYLAELYKQTGLNAAGGDGVKSFIGLLLVALSNNVPMLLVDEPELFLHPDQAERIAALFVETIHEYKRQIIVATHSSAFVRSAIANSRNVTICRFSNDHDHIRTSTLNNAQIEELMSKPLVRSVQVVEGIFYNGVIVCEGDGDARFYEGLAQRFRANASTEKQIDMYFVSGGGKSELATLASVYQKLKIKTAVIADLDLLQNVTEFRKVLFSLDIEFSQIERQYNSVQGALKNLPSKTPDDFATQIGEIAADIRKHQVISPAHRSQIGELLETSKKWSEAKKHGINALRGGVHQDAQQLLNLLKQQGLFLVPVGTLESWSPEGSANKADWIRDALQTIYDEQSSFKDATEFIQEVYAYLVIQRAQGA